MARQYGAVAHGHLFWQCLAGFGKHKESIRLPLL